MSCFHITRDPEEQAKAFADEEFMAWLRKYEPDYKTELWDRNVTAMYHAYLAGKDKSVFPEGSGSMELKEGEAA